MADYRVKYTFYVLLLYGALCNIKRWLLLHGLSLLGLWRSYVVRITARQIVLELCDCIHADYHHCAIHLLTLSLGRKHKHRHRHGQNISVFAALQYRIGEHQSFYVQESVSNVLF